MKMKYNDIFSQEDKNIIINDYVCNGYSIKRLMIKYNIKSKSWVEKLLKGKTRTTSEAARLFNNSHPGYRKECVTEHTRNIMREHRLRYMKEHPEDTAWRRRNEPSYPERCFINFLKEKGYDKKFLIIREHSVFPFYIDFAFVDIKVAVEIDGSQHLELERKQRDDEKDKVLLENGWKILRISDYAVKNDWDSISNTLNELIGTKGDNVYKRVGIVKEPKSSIKKERGEDGFTDKERESYIKQRIVVDRPDAEMLKELLYKYNFKKVGEMYGVSDKTIRNWCIIYNMPQHSKYYK